MMTFNKNIIDSIVLWQCGTVERGKIVGTLYKKLNTILLGKIALQCQLFKTDNMCFIFDRMGKISYLKK